MHQVFATAGGLDQEGATEGRLGVGGQTQEQHGGGVHARGVAEDQTGGGAKLDGLLELAEQIFSSTVRFGLPRGLGGLVDVINCPTWSAASGLLLYGLEVEENQGRHQRRRMLTMRNLIGTLRGYFSDLL